ncbi:Hypothetical protein Cul210932_1326 [Corynebacterium ulcerans]|nr:Hypothetical protein Cul210932_1326 [Corynebacterium ulcerans]ALD95047.1 Hypothetical protein Cul131001_1343 [Corynebacterium ulcerans]
MLITVEGLDPRADVSGVKTFAYRMVKDVLLDQLLAHL